MLLRGVGCLALLAMKLSQRSRFPTCVPSPLRGEGQGEGVLLGLSFPLSPALPRKGGRGWSRPSGAGCLGNISVFATKQAGHTEVLIDIGPMDPFSVGENFEVF